MKILSMCAIYITNLHQELHLQNDQHQYLTNSEVIIKQKLFIRILFPLTIIEAQVMHSTSKVVVLNIIIFITAPIGACLTTIEEAQMSATRRGQELR